MALVHGEVSLNLAIIWWIIAGMVFQCFEWVRQLVRELFSPKSFLDENKIGTDIPHDITINILNRLPAKQVVICRRVCKEWQLLTSSKFFMDLRRQDCGFRHSILVYDDLIGWTSYDDAFQVFLHDGTPGKTFKKIQLRLRLKGGFRNIYGPPILVHSCSGFLLLRKLYYTGSMLYVLNPITREQNEVAVAPEGIDVHSCFFFHPLTGEFKILGARKRGNSVHYFINVVGSRFWRKVSSPSCAHVFPRIQSPAILHGSLHWIVSGYYRNEDDMPPCTNAILVFRMDTEEFLILPHPGTKCSNKFRHERMHIFVMEEQSLGFGGPDYNPKTIQIWILENYDSWDWVKRWSINVQHLNHIAGMSDIFYHLLRWRMLILQKINGCLWFSCRGIGIMIYDLEHGTMRKIRMPKCWGDYSFILFEKTLLSLKKDAR